MRGPLAPGGVPVARSRAQRFDDLVLDSLERLERRFTAELSGVEIAVEEVPDPHRFGSTDSAADNVPLGALVTTRERPRIVVYRRPIELRATSRGELAALVGEVVLEQVAELLGVDPDEIDPA